MLHGGTSIWRCYGGRRFSEDMDFYTAPKSSFRADLEGEAKKHDLTLSRFRKTANTIYARISDTRTEISIEASLRQKRSTELREYEKADGSHTDVYTLSTEDLILEKANAFLHKRLIRDIYDVYFLSAGAELGKIGKELKAFLVRLPNPVDEKNLRTLIYTGPVPTFREMVSTLKRRLGE